MKAISIGKTFEIYDDSLLTYDKLPAQVYTIRFSQMKGFYLEKHQNIEINEEKIYGVHLQKIQKVIKSFEKMERNLGVILSGDKGIGKSLFAKILSNEVVSKGYPVIIVDTYYPGIASYIEDIEQECMILFDEFDKTFASIKHNEDASPQSTLLSLFDGMAQGKKLFVITCNEFRSLNDFLINRPGRFHYHIRFDYPSPNEIKEYLTDKLEKTFYSEIEKVVSFSRKVSLNYDCLRAIAFEINLGETFEEAIKDLNIINTREEMYNIRLLYKDGTELSSKRLCIDMFSDSKESFNLWDNEGYDVVTIEFNPKKDLKYDSLKFAHYLLPKDINLIYDNYDKEISDKYKDKEVEAVLIERFQKNNIHYAV